MYIYIYFWVVYNFNIVKFHSIYFFYRTTIVSSRQQILQLIGISAMEGVALCVRLSYATRVKVHQSLTANYAS